MSGFQAGRSNGRCQENEMTHHSLQYEAVGAMLIQEFSEFLSEHGVVSCENGEPLAYPILQIVCRQVLAGPSRFEAQHGEAPSDDLRRRFIRFIDRLFESGDERVRDLVREEVLDTLIDRRCVSEFQPMMGHALRDALREMAHLRETEDDDTSEFGESTEPFSLDAFVSLSDAAELWEYACGYMKPGMTEDGTDEICRGFDSLDEVHATVALQLVIRRMSTRVLDLLIRSLSHRDRGVRILACRSLQGVPGNLLTPERIDRVREEIRSCPEAAEVAPTLVEDLTRRVAR